MEKEIVFVLLDEFADWEAAFLAPALCSGVMPGRPGSYAAKYMSPDGESVRSIGGLRATPDYDASTLPESCAGLILVGCCPGGVSSNIMSYLCGGDVAFSVGMTTVSTILSPVMTPLLVSFLASGTHISIKALPMLVSIVETVILPVALGFLLNYLFGKKKTFGELQKIMPGIAVLGLACVVGGVVSSQGAKFFESGVIIFVAVFLHNGLGYLLGYGAGRLVGMNTAKKRTIAIEVGMQNAGLATNLATTTAQFASTPESAIICAVSCTWHSISGTLLAGMFAFYDKCKKK